MKLLMIFLFSLILESAIAQEANRCWRIGVSTSQTALPFGALSRLFYRDFHPGLELAYRVAHHTSGHHSWEHEPGVSYMFHRWVQHNASISFNEYYTHNLGTGFAATARAGVGYQLSIPAVDVYTIGEEIRRKKIAGRSQFVFNAAFGLQKQMNKHWKVSLLYQQLVQTPFVKSYVPLLPYNSLILSAIFPIHVSTPAHETH